MTFAPCPPPRQILHASCVHVRGRGLLILGPSHSGKSSLALELIAKGADLVSDDQTSITSIDGRVFASPAPNLCGLIETRGLGLIQMPYVNKAPLHMVINLSYDETQRLPLKKQCSYFGITLPLLYKPQTHAYASALFLLLKDPAHITLLEQTN